MEITGAKIIDTTGEDFFITMHPDFPNDTSRKKFSSPFIDAASRHGEDFVNRVSKRFLWKDILEKDSKKLKQIYKNYKQKKWSHFSNNVNEYLPDWQVKEQLDRNRALYQILELCLFPIVTSKRHLDTIQLLCDFLIDVRTKDDKNFMIFLTHLDQAKILENTQNNSFKYTFRFFDLGKEFYPILIDWDPDKPDTGISKNLKLMNDTPFDKIKAFYVDGYELACDSLVIIQGLINIKYRMDYNSFPEHPTINRGKPFTKTLDDYNRAPNAPKLGILFEEKLIDNWLNSAIDPKLRNAIGHGDVEFDETKEIIKFAINKEKNQFVTLTYAEFLLNCIRLFTVIHQINHLVKMLYVHIYMTPNPKFGVK